MGLRIQAGCVCIGCKGWRGYADYRGGGNWRGCRGCAVNRALDLADGIDERPYVGSEQSRLDCPRFVSNFQGCIFGMSNHPSPRLLLVEDDIDTACLIAETLEDHFGAGCIDKCALVADAMAVDLDKYDLVLSDMNLPDGNGLKLLNEFLRKRPDLPFVLITGEGILENAIAAIRRGAYDYIVKAGDYLFAIPLIVEKNLAIWRTKQDNQRLQEQLAKTLKEVQVKNGQLAKAVRKLRTMAATDPLTHLFNRRSFGQALDRCFAEADRYGHDVACVMIDLDNFKQMNDTLGHQAGDDLLRLTARVLKAQCRRSDVIGRFGGDEFVVLLPQTDEQTARQVASRIGEEFKAGVNKLYGGEGMSFDVSLSMGVATLNQARPSTPQQLVAYADKALYCAKQAGKTCLVTYSNLQDDQRHWASDDLARHA